MHTVTADEIDFYRKHGFVVIEGFLDAGELEAWRVAVTEALDDRGSLPMPPSTGAHLNEALADQEQRQSEAERQQYDYYRRVFTQRINLWQTSEAVRRLVLDPALGKAACELAGVEGVRMWHDQALIKEPFGNPTGFHLDVPYWSFTSPHAISVWVALDDATLENGCLYYVPGSHKAEKYTNVGIGPALGALFDVYPEWRDVPPVACPVRAGGALFHNGLTFHGAGANMTPRRRRAMTAGFMPEGSTFNGIANILRPEVLARLSVGDLLDDDEQNPLVYSTRTPVAP